MAEPDAGLADDARARRDAREARQETVRAEREEARKKKRELDAKKTASALARFVRGNVITVVFLLFLPTVLGTAFFLAGAQMVDKSFTFKWGWGMLALYAGLLLNIPWAKYVAPRLDRVSGKVATAAEEAAS